jgi:hypothetical protein
MPQRDDAGQPPPGDTSNTEGHDDEFHRVIRRFTRALRILLLRDPDPLPEFGAFRAAVLDSIESPDVIDGTSRALAAVHRDAETTEAAHLLAVELDAFSASVDRTQSAGTAITAADRPLWKRLLGIGKTAGDSLREILEKYLGPRAKAIWKLLTEAVDIARGD